MPLPGNEASAGLRELSSTICRAMSLHCAIITSEEGTLDDEVFLRAEQYAQWINGRPEVSAPAPLGRSLRDMT